MKRPALLFIVMLIFFVIALGFYIFKLKKSETLRSGESDNFYQAYNSGENTAAGNMNFINAARRATAGVVHIKSTFGRSSQVGSFLEEIYGPSFRGNVPARSAGSGVIISDDGYIVTNNHVIENAGKIEVVLSDRREFAAELVGRDPNTDLALLKIDAVRLSALRFGDSDSVQVGQWVLAVGYPYSLNTTVTAGIISAKARSIGIINSAEDGSAQPGNTAIESFIQTDAAINAGNSGGALVNTNGELIGINTAIASLTGSYSGYAFAIPVNLAKKIIKDLRDFGQVKRGILGVSFPSPAAEDLYLKQQGIEPGSVKGVFITNIQGGSAAASAGLKEGDIIQSIDGIPLFSSSEFSERIARHGPGDKIKLTFLRNGKVHTASVTLKGEERSLKAREQTLKEIYRKLGASFSQITPALKQRFNLSSGVLVTEVFAGGFFDQLGIPPGTIIAYINGKEVSGPADIERAFIDAGSGRIQILAIAPDGSKVAFNFSFGA